MKTVLGGGSQRSLGLNRMRCSNSSTGSSNVCSPSKCPRGAGPGGCGWCLGDAGLSRPARASHLQEFLLPSAVFSRKLTPLFLPFRVSAMTTAFAFPGSSARPGPQPGGSQRRLLPPGRERGDNLSLPTPVNGEEPEQMTGHDGF